MSRRSRAGACLHRPPTCLAMSNARAESGASRRGLSGLTAALPRGASPHEVARDGVRVTEACVRFFGVGQYLLFRHGRHPHPNTGITFRGRATPSFARALPVARTSPLRRTGASAVVRPRDCIRPSARVPEPTAAARLASAFAIELLPFALTPMRRTRVSGLPGVAWVSGQVVRGAGLSACARAKSRMI
jgi:hypothetical protein